MLASNPVFSFGAKAKRFGSVAFLLALAPSLGAKPASPSSVSALVPGETIRYLIEYRSTIRMQSTGPIYTPAAAHQLDVSVGARMRLDVLGVKTGLGRSRLTRLRVTYETCDANVHSDAYDPGALALQKQYRALKGRSFTFAIDGQGRVVDIAGLDHLGPDETARNAIRQWLSSVTLPLGVWDRRLKPGKKWSREVPIAGAPIAGLAWRARSTYRDNESCPAPLSSQHRGQRQTCAVVTTRMATVQEGHHRDSTPLRYRRQGLKTSGRWSGSGQSLSYISLSSGLVASSTSSESDRMDLTVTAALSGSRLRYAGAAHSNSQIALIGVTLPGEHSKSSGVHPRPSK